MMEIKSFFLVIVNSAILKWKTGKMGRPPNIINETTGRLTTCTAEKPSKTKKFTIHKRKEILQLFSARRLFSARISDFLL